MIQLSGRKNSMDPNAFLADPVRSRNLKVIGLYAEAQSPLMLVLVFIAIFCSVKSEQWFQIIFFCEIG